MHVGVTVHVLSISKVDTSNQVSYVQSSGLLYDFSESYIAKHLICGERHDTLKNSYFSCFFQVALEIYKDCKPSLLHMTANFIPPDR